MANVETVLGIDIGTTSIKAAKLIKGASGYAAQLLGIQAIAGGAGASQDNMFGVPEQAQGGMDAEAEGATPGNSDELRDAAVLEALKRLVSESRVSRGTRCALSISGGDVATRSFSFPHIDDAGALENAIRFEAENELPFSMDDAIIDFQVFHQSEPGKSQGLYVGARRSAVDRRFELARAAGLEPVIVDVDSLALTNCFIQAGGGEPPQRETLVLNIGHRNTNLAVVLPDGRSFIRDIPLGGESLTRAVANNLNVSFEEAEVIKAGASVDQPNSAENVERLQPFARNVLYEGMEELLNQIRDSIGFFINTQHLFETVNDAWITGGAASFPGLPDYLGEIFHVPTSGWNALQDINLQFVEEGRNPARADSVGPQFAVALGLAMRPDIG